VRSITANESGMEDLGMKHGAELIAGAISA